jgi:hypothetical protein
VPHLRGDVPEAHQSTIPELRSRQDFNPANVFAFEVVIPTESRPFLERARRVEGPAFLAQKADPSSD